MGTYTVQWSGSKQYVITNNGKLSLKGTSSSSKANIGSYQYGSTYGVYNASGATLSCTYINFSSYLRSLFNYGTATISTSSLATVSDKVIYSYGGTVSLTSSTLAVNASGYETIYVSGSTLNINSGTITSGLGEKAITAIGTAAINIKGGTISSDTRSSCDDALISHSGSGTINMTGGTINNTKHNMAIAVNGTASFTMSAGTINASNAHALKTTSSANPSIYITGGTINHTTAKANGNDWCAILAEMKTSGEKNYIKITGGTILSKYSCVIGVSDGGTGAIEVNIGSSSSSATATSPTLIAADSSAYVLEGLSSSQSKVTFWNGRMYTKKTDDYASNFGKSLRSGYTRKVTSSTYSYTFSGTTYTGLYYHYLSANS